MPAKPLRERAVPESRLMSPFAPDRHRSRCRPGGPAVGAPGPPGREGYHRRRVEPERATIVVEDIHWADPSTREMLDSMTRRLQGTRILVLATYRNDELHRRHPLRPILQAWRRSGTARVVELQPLTAERIAEMVRAIFATDEVGSEFRDFMHARSEGNPGDPGRSGGRGRDRHGRRDHRPSRGGRER